MMGQDFEGPPEPERFRICNGMGSTLDSRDCIEDALAEMRRRRLAACVVDSVSGATMARKMTRLHSRLLKTIGVA